MVALAANLSADQEWIPLSEADSLSLAVGYYTIDSEYVYVDTGAHPATSISIPTYNGRRARRGEAGSTAASHLSGATLTRYYPDAPGGDPGGSGIPQGGPLTEALDADGNAITGLADPTDPQDAATMAYVDEATDGMAGPLLSFTINLSAGQIATLSSVPVEVVAAPGANKAIVPVAATFQYKPGAVGFTNPAGLDLLYGDPATDGTGMDTVPAEVAFDELSASLIVFSRPAVLIGMVDCENQALMVEAALDPDGAGDGTARLTVVYFVMDLLV